jgi:hypothetical protein
VAMALALSQCLVPMAPFAVIQAPSWGHIVFTFALWTSGGSASGWVSTSYSYFRSSNISAWQLVSLPRCLRLYPVLLLLQVYALGFNALGPAAVAISALLAGLMLAGPSARAGAMP